MTCDGCERHLTQTLEEAGARDVTVNWRKGSARFLLVDGADEASLRTSVEKAGYQPTDLRVVRDTAPHEEPRGLPHPTVGSTTTWSCSAAAITARDAGRASNALLGADRGPEYRGLPRVTFSAPQIAGAGLTEAQSGRRPRGAHQRPGARTRAARAREPRHARHRQTHRGRCVGTATGCQHGVADGASDAIHTAVLAIRHGLTVEELAATFHSCLTMAEAWKLAAQTSTATCCAVPLLVAAGVVASAGVLLRSLALVGAGLLLVGWPVASAIKRLSRRDKRVDASCTPEDVDGPSYR